MPQNDSLTPAQRSLCGQGAAHEPCGHKDDRVAAYVEKVLAHAPPLSDEQRDRLAELLRPARGGAA